MQKIVLVGPLSAALKSGKYGEMYLHLAQHSGQLLPIPLWTEEEQPLPSDKKRKCIDTQTMKGVSTVDNTAELPKTQ